MPILTIVARPNTRVLDEDVYLTVHVVLGVQNVYGMCLTAFMGFLSTPVPAMAFALVMITNWRAIARLTPTSASGTAYHILQGRL